MLVGTVRRPGAKGTRKLVEQYADRLVCVHYRHDLAQGSCDKTAEPIVEEVGGVPRLYQRLPTPINECSYEKAEPTRRSSEAKKASTFGAVELYR